MEVLHTIHTFTLAGVLQFCLQTEQFNAMEVLCIVHVGR